MASTSVVRPGPQGRFGARAGRGAHERGGDPSSAGWGPVNRHGVGCPTPSREGPRKGVTCENGEEKREDGHKKGGGLDRAGGKVRPARPRTSCRRARHPGHSQLGLDIDFGKSAPSPNPPVKRGVATPSSSAEVEGKVSRQREEKRKRKTGRTQSAPPSGREPRTNFVQKELVGGGKVDRPSPAGPPSPRNEVRSGSTPGALPRRPGPSTVPSTREPTPVQVEGPFLYERGTVHEGLAVGSGPKRRAAGLELRGQGRPLDPRLGRPDYSRNGSRRVADGRVTGGTDLSLSDSSSLTTSPTVNGTKPQGK